MRNLFMVLMLLTEISLSSAQTVVFDTAKVSKQNKQIYIPYKIVETPKEAGKHLYDIYLYYSQDKGNTYKGPLTKVAKEGEDFGEYLLPGEKTIVWNYYEENPTFNGQDVWFRLDVKTNLNPFAVGGPENAAYSLLLPGLGNTKVRHYPKLWYLHTIAGFGMLGTGLLLNNKSNKTYDKYLHAQTFEQTRSFYNQSNTLRTTGRALILAGAAVWLTDIIRVAVKGFKNRKAQKELLEKYPRLKEKYGFHFNMDYDFYYQQPSFSVGFKF